MTAPSRTLTTIAVGFLALDAVLLGYLGFALKRLVLVGAAAACAAGAAAVVLAWRRYRRILAELARARRAMKDEADALRILLHGHHFHN
jgi:uncharacterized membrane protein YccC